MDATAISLKIFLPSTGSTKTLRFPSQSTIDEAIQVILERTGVGASDFGMYQAQKAGLRAPRWLDNSRTLASYQLESGDQVEFRTKQSPIKVKMPDGSSKKMFVDTSSRVEEIIAMVGGKMEIHNPEEYGLKVEGANGQTRWLKVSQTMQEQGVLDAASLQFEKRFYVDDFNVDRSNPQQLNLMYAQSRDAILSGQYPVQAEEAIKFAALQLQVEIGNFDPSTHSNSTVRKGNRFLPKTWAGRGLESSIIKEWATLTNTNDVNARFRYIQYCRQLSTYGITTFLVREKRPKKRKLQPVLLGVTRDCVMRMDPESKEVLQKFPLNHVRRWAAATRSFTLDFGTYYDDYYSVQTMQADEIGQLLAGYIDILLKRQLEGRKVAEEDVGDIAALEELTPVVAVPQIATIREVGVGNYTSDDFRENELMPGMMMFAQGSGFERGGSIQAPSLDAASGAAGKLRAVLDAPVPRLVRGGAAGKVQAALMDASAPRLVRGGVAGRSAMPVNATGFVTSGPSSVQAVPNPSPSTAAPRGTLSARNRGNQARERPPVSTAPVDLPDIPMLLGASARGAGIVPLQPASAAALHKLSTSAKMLVADLEEIPKLTGATARGVQKGAVKRDLQAMLDAARAAAAAGEDNVSLLDAARRVNAEVEALLRTDRPDAAQVQAVLQSMDNLIPRLMAGSAAGRVMPLQLPNVAPLHQLSTAATLLTADLEEIPKLAGVTARNAQKGAVKRDLQAMLDAARAAAAAGEDNVSLLDAARRVNAEVEALLRTDRPDADQVQAVVQAVQSDLVPLLVARGASATQTPLYKLNTAGQVVALAPGEVPLLAALSAAGQQLLQDLPELPRLLRAAQRASIARSPKRNVEQDVQAMLDAAKAAARSAADNVSLLEAARRVNAAVEQLLTTNRPANDSIAAIVPLVDATAPLLFRATAKGELVPLTPTDLQALARGESLASDKLQVTSAAQLVTGPNGVPLLFRRTAGGQVVALQPAEVAPLQRINQSARLALQNLDQIPALVKGGAGANVRAPLQRVAISVQDMLDAAGEAAAGAEDNVSLLDAAKRVNAAVEALLRTDRSQDLAPAAERVAPLVLDAVPKLMVRTVAGELVPLQPGQAWPGVRVDVSAAELRDKLLGAGQGLGRSVTDLLNGLEGPAAVTNENAQDVIDQLSKFIAAARTAAAATDNISLLEAAKRVTSAVEDVLQCSRAVEADPEDAKPKGKLRDAVDGLQGATQYLRGTITGDLADPASEHLVLNSTLVAAAAVKMVAGNVNAVAKAVAKTVGPAAAEPLLKLVRLTAAAAEQVAKKGKVLAPLVVDPVAKLALVEVVDRATQLCHKAVDDALADSGCPARAQPRLKAALASADAQLEQLGAAVDVASHRAAKDKEDLNARAHKLLGDLNAFKGSMGDPQSMAAAARLVQSNLPPLLQAAKCFAASHPEHAPNMVAAAAGVTEAGNALIGAVPPAMASADDVEPFKEVLRRAQTLATATKELAAPAHATNVFDDVRAATKRAAAACTGLCHASRAAIRKLEDPVDQKRLFSVSKDAQDAVGSMVDALRDAALEPDQVEPQGRLVALAKDSCPMLAAIVNATRELAPQLTDVALAHSLKFEVAEASRAVSDLVDACTAAGDVTGEDNLDAAQRQIVALERDMVNTLVRADSGALVQVLPRDEAVAMLRRAVAQVTQHTTALADIGGPQDVGAIAKLASLSVSDVAEAATAVASAATEHDEQRAILDAAKALLPDLQSLIESARANTVEPDGLSLTAAAKAVSDRIRDVLATSNAGTGAEELSVAADQVLSALGAIRLAPTPKAGDVVSLASVCEDKARACALTAEDVVSQAREPINEVGSESTVAALKDAAKAAAVAMPALVNAVNKITPCVADPVAQDAIVRATQALGGQLAKVLNAASSSRADPVSSEAEVVAAHAGVPKALAQLQSALQQATPGLQELEKAVAMLDTTCAMTEPVQPVAVATALRNMGPSSATLGNAVVRMVQAARVDPQRLGVHSVEAARAVADLVNVARALAEDADPEAAAKAAPLLRQATELAHATNDMVTQAAEVVTAPESSVAQAALVDAGKAVGRHMKAMKTAAKQLTPGHAECEAAQRGMEVATDRVDEAAMCAAVGVLEVAPTKAQQAAREDLVQVSKALVTRVQALVDDADDQALHAMGEDAVATSELLDSLVDNSVELASAWSSPDQQMEHLNHVADVGDSVQSLGQLTLALTSEPHNDVLHQDLLGAAQCVRDAMQDLVSSLRGGVEGLRACDEAMATMADCSEVLEAADLGDAVRMAPADAQAALTRAAQDAAVAVTQLFHQAKTEPDGVAEPSLALAEAVAAVTAAVQGAAMATDDALGQEALLDAGRTVATAASRLVATCKKVAGDAGNDLLVEDLARSFQAVTQAVTTLVRSAKQGATAERDCADAMATIRRWVAEVDGAAVLAATGEFEVDSELTLDVCQEELLEAVNDVASLAMELSESAAASQTVLGAAARNVAAAFARLAECATVMAGTTGDLVAQADVLGCTKAVGKLAGQLVRAAQEAQASGLEGDSVDLLDDRTVTLDEGTKELVQCTVMAFGAAVEGVRKLRAAQSVVAKEVDHGAATGASVDGPESVLAPLRGVVAACAVLAPLKSTTHPDLATAADDMGRHGAAMLRAARGAANLATEEGVRAAVTKSGEDVALLVIALLEWLMRQRKDGAEYADAVAQLADGVEATAETLVRELRNVPGGANLELAEDTLADSAANELMAAAAEIQRAAQMLLDAPQRVRHPGADLDEADIAEGILDAAREVTQSTYDLMRAAIAAQREIDGDSSGAAHRSDAEWAQGFIAAVKEVAAATNDLVEAANMVAKGDIGEEAAVATSRQVQATIARLWASAKAKLDPVSPVQAQLSQAQGAVVSATRELAQCARQAVELDVAKEESKPMSAFALKAAQLESQEKLNAIQRDLDSAHRRLKAARRDAYAGQQTTAPTRTRNPTVVNRARGPTTSRRPTTARASTRARGSARASTRMRTSTRTRL